ncbi:MULTISPECIES: hypothetical protein [Pseudoalteromonas]|uniref:hypothetical protein n=1 Tax=Pseudoalteromonas TaxID=53246 RepID=UPI0015816108|nr:MULTISPECIES: hypothetical protein [Pseudoalteromonas]MDI4652625.1 hypothetical protein [Pseudoalteromonas shioyasakiensis]NUJ38665.1 hypothetical protein [Pseudoalteromonas sp. 0303]
MNTEIQTLNNQTPAPFSHDNLINYGEYKNSNNICLTSEQRYFRGDIPMDKIVGIDQMYGDGTWGECLEGKWLKRIASNLEELRANPEYFLSDQHHNLSFIKVGDNYFISEGKHRSVIARFLAHFNPERFTGVSPLRNVSITEYFIDTQYLDIKRKVDNIAQRYPHLVFKLKHYTSQSEVGFLKVSFKKGELPVSNMYEFYSREEVDHIIGALDNPTFSGKRLSVKPSRNRLSIYDFITYKECLKSEYKNLKQRLFGK